VAALNEEKLKCPIDHTPSIAKLGVVTTVVFVPLRKEPYRLSQRFRLNLDIAGGKA